MNSVEQLMTVPGQFFALSAELEDLSRDARGWQDAALVVRVVRGQKARTLESLFDEFAAAFQFPHYFGENWAAFRDCVTDLDWLPFQPGVVVVFHQAGQVLEDANPTELRTLVASLSEAAAEFGNAISDGEWWDRPPVPFHVVVQGKTADEFERWRAAGAKFSPLALDSE